MTIRILFNEIGLPAYAIDQFFNEINRYNLKNPETLLSRIDLDAGVDTITLSQVPFIGRALAKVQGIAFLDEDRLFPLTVDENALHFAMKVLDKYYNADKRGSGKQ